MATARQLATCLFADQVDITPDPNDEDRSRRAIDMCVST